MKARLIILKSNAHSFSSPVGLLNFFLDVESLKGKENLAIGENICLRKKLLFYSSFLPGGGSVPATSILFPSAFFDDLTCLMASFVLFFLF